MREQERTTTLPGVLATISAGFDLTTRHLWLLLLPAVLDVFYWLGPRLRFQTLIDQLLALLPQEAEVLELSSQLADIAPQTNLFTTITVQLIGVPALMVGMAPKVTPLAASFLEINSWSVWFGLFIIFSVTGLLLTSLFYTLITVALNRQSAEVELLTAPLLVKRVISSWIRLIGLVLIFLLIVMILYIPLIIIGTILFLINNTLGSIALLMGPFVLAWVVIFLSMAPYGIVLGRPLRRAVVESVHLVRLNLPSVIYLLFSILIIGALLDWLLFAVENGTWLTLANILGHAFVSTALVAALFIFYQDRYAALFDPGAVHEIRPLQDNDN